MDLWKAMHHTDFWSYEMMVYHNSLSSCPYACPRCAIKQLNQVETDVMIQKEKINLQEVMARRPGKSFGWLQLICLLSLSLSMRNCIHPQTDRKLLLNFISAG